MCVKADADWMVSTYRKEYGLSLTAPMDPVRLPLPPWHNSIGSHTAFTDLAVGIMVRSFGSAHIRVHLQTWIKNARGVMLVLLADCSCPNPIDSHDRSCQVAAPKWLTARCDAEVRCFQETFSAKNSALKAAALWAALLEHRRDYYVKLDTDTVVEPLRLLQLFDQALVAATKSADAAPLIYLGTDDNIDRISVKNRIVRNSRFEDLEANVSQSGWSFGYAAPRRLVHPKQVITLVQGGFEALSRAALKALVGTQCLQRMAEADIPGYPPPSVEDIALGLCMHMLRVRPILSDCIHPWAPCPCIVPNRTSWAMTCTDTAAGRRKRSNGKLTSCLTGAVALHRMRQVKWYWSCWAWMHGGNGALPGLEER